MATASSFMSARKSATASGMDEVRLARMADLAPVLEGREHVGPPEQLDVGVGAVGADFFEQILEANHRNSVSKLQCKARLDVRFFASLYWPGFGHGNFLTS